MKNYEIGKIITIGDEDFKIINIEGEYVQVEEVGRKCPNVKWIKVMITVEEETAEETAEVEKAIKKWNKLKVSKIALVDDSMETIEKEYQSYFDYIWYRTLFEYDLYIENQDNNQLTTTTAKSTFKWLKENRHLTKEFSKVSI